MVLEQLFAEWTGAQLANFLVSTATFGSVLVLMFMVYKKMRYENRGLRLQSNEIAQNNIRRAIAQIERSKQRILSSGNILASLMNGDVIENKDAIKDVKDLLNELDILGLKYYELDLDLEIIYRITGKVAIAVHDNQTVRNIIKEAQDKNEYAYDNFTKMIKEMNEFKLPSDLDVDDDEIDIIDGALPARRRTTPSSRYNY